MVAALLLLGACGSDPAQRVATIAQDGGGSIEAYAAKYREIAASGGAIRVDGLCASACTLLLAYVPPAQICLTRQARFGFHSVFSAEDRDGRRPVASLATLEIYQSYPDWLRRLIAGFHDHWGGAPLPPPNGLLVIGGGFFVSHGYRMCPATRPGAGAAASLDP